MQNDELDREELITFRLPIRDLHMLRYHLTELRHSQGDDMFSLDYYDCSHSREESIKVLDKMIDQINPNYPSKRVLPDR